MKLICDFYWNKPLWSHCIAVIEVMALWWWFHVQYYKRFPSSSRADATDSLFKRRTHTQPTTWWIVVTEPRPRCPLPSDTPAVTAHRHRCRQRRQTDLCDCSFKLSVRDGFVEILFTSRQKWINQMNEIKNKSGLCGCRWALTSQSN